jgi:peptide/nickel transport system substrate-binding protein
MTIRIANDITCFDPYQGELLTEVLTGYMEQLFTPSWTTDPSVQNYQLSFWDSSFVTGGLAQSWEFTTPGTFVLNLHQGVYWQDIAPSNGREFTAADVVYHFDRMCGLGDGFTQFAPYWSTVSWLQSLVSVTATNDFTVVMKFSTPNPDLVLESMEYPDVSTTIEDPDAVAAYGNLNNWHNAIGTGSFMLTDFVDSSSATLVRNPNYWGTDERYPQNKLPYVNGINVLIIPTASTAEAAMRTGKIDIMDGVSLQDAQSMGKTNPQILQIGTPQGNAVTIDPRNDKTPFNILQVREALQMAINLPQIASTYYDGTCSPDPSTLTSNYMTGWGYPYSQWPASLQAQYAYNPTEAKQLLTAAGYPNGFNTDCVVVNTADLTLLQIVQSEFTSIGVNMAIDPMDLATFSGYVVTSHQNDALAMRQPGANSLGVTYYPLRQFAKFESGQSGDIAMVNDPVFNAFYPQALATTSTDDLKTVVTNMDQYVAQQHFVISLLQPMQYSLCQPWLKGYNGQYGATSGPAGPLILYFYGARMFIDQNLKP